MIAGIDIVRKSVHVRMVLVRESNSNDKHADVGLIEHVRRALS